MTITARPVRGAHPTYLAVAEQGALRVYGIGRTRREAKRRAMESAAVRLSQIARLLSTVD